MKILDAKGVVLDTDARDVTVRRCARTRRRSFRRRCIRARSAREFREAVGSANAAPAPLAISGAPIGC